MKKAVIISQLKYTGQLEDVLFLRAVRRINRFIKPDIVIIFTDKRHKLAECLLEIIKKIKCAVNIDSENNAELPEYKEIILKYSCSELAPDFNAKPFEFLEVDISAGGRETVTVQQLSVPAGLELFDYHVHSHFAYCSENMNLEDAVKLAEMFNLKGIAFTEHNRHLYYEKAQLQLPVVERHEVSRVDDYFAELAEYRSDKVLAGLELDFDFSGAPTMRMTDIEKFDIVLGSVHGLPRLSFEDSAISSSNFKGIWLNAVKTPISVMAHPLRVIWKGSSGGSRLSHDDYLWLADLLKEHNIAAEMNFHSNNPDPEFFRICLEKDVRISLGTDSHNLAGIGEFYPHLKMLDELNALDKLDSILYRH